MVCGAGPLHFFLRGPHKLLHNNSRGDNLSNVVVSGYVTLHSTNSTRFLYFLYMIFSLLTKWLCGSDEMASRTAFGPRVLNLETPGVV